MGDWLLQRFMPHLHLTSSMLASTSDHMCSVWAPAHQEHWIPRRRRDQASWQVKALMEWRDILKFYPLHEEKQNDKLQKMMALRPSDWDNFEVGLIKFFIPYINSSDDRIWISKSFYFTVSPSKAFAWLLLAGSLDKFPSKGLLGLLCWRTKTKREWMLLN